MRRLIAIALLLLGGRMLFCQEIESRQIPEEVIEIIREYAESIASEGGDTENFIEELTELYQNLLRSPLNINNASREDLERLVILNDFQIESIIDYRKEYGTLLSINELSLIAGFDSKVVKILTPFIYVAPGESQDLSIKSLLRDGKSQIILRGKSLIEKQLGYTPVTREEFEKNPNCRYLGLPGQIYAQFKYEYSDRLRVGFTLEKDGGETGVDYKSINISFYKTGLIDRVLIGDYSARFGQGLILWNSFSMNSSIEPRSLRKSEMGICPYNSTDENLSFRGIAATLQIKKLKVTLLGSYRPYDARVEDGLYTSLLKTGLHNTTVTRERKGSLTGSLIGSNFTFTGDKFKISGNMILYKYNLAYGGRDSLKRLKDSLSGGYGGNLSIDFYWVFDKTRLFGELASDHSGSFAWLAGLLYSPNNRFDASVLIRDYSKKYYAPFAGAISRGSIPNDERGIKASAALYVGKYWRLSSSLEIINGYQDFAFTANYKQDKGTSFYLKLLQTQQRYSIRYNIDYKVIPWVRFVNRVDITASNEEKFHVGAHVFHEAVYESMSKKFNASFRVAAFSTPVWNVRIYSYERDVLYGFSVPVYYGTGVRWYFNIHLSPLRSLDVWFRISQTRYLDRNEIGEGLDLITGHSKSEVKLQIRWRF
ncbi:MAG: helix-hairpin-helix domain-containing protein [Rikenellaceae bacterium]